MNQQDYYPLIEAIEDGDVAAVESFLQIPGIYVDFLFDRDDDYTALLLAIYLNRQTIVEVLLAHGAAVNGRVGAIRTPLQEACIQENANEDIVNLLLEQGADVDGMPIDRRETPLTLASSSENKLGIVQQLLDAGADVNGGGGDLAPLHCAASFGNIEALELLIEAGADVIRLSTDDVSAGTTPLHCAAYKGGLKSVNTLLVTGADPNISDAEGQTPLHLAAWYSSVQIFNALLDAGCDPLHRDNQGRTPLQHLYYENIRYNRNFSTNHFNTITDLVVAGDRSWQCVPTPCPGLEAAMVSVWQAAPDELPALVERIENPPQTLIELYARMDDDSEMKKVVQEVQRVLHRHFAGYPEVKEHLLKAIFGLAIF